MSMQELGDDTPSRDGEHHQSVMMHRFLKHLHPSSAPLTPAPSVPEDDGHTHTHTRLGCVGMSLVNAVCKQMPQSCSERRHLLPPG